MAKMQHPDSDRVIDVPPAQQAMYASQGWVRLDHKPVPEPDQQ